MPTDGILRNATVYDVMDISSERLCFRGSSGVLLAIGAKKRKLQRACDICRRRKGQSHIRIEEASRLIVITLAFPRSTLYVRLGPFRQSFSVWNSLTPRDPLSQLSRPSPPTQAMGRQNPRTGVPIVSPETSVVHMSSSKWSVHFHAIRSPILTLGSQRRAPRQSVSATSFELKLTSNTVYRPAETLDTRLDKMEKMLNNVHPQRFYLLYFSSDVHHRHSQKGTTTSIRRARAAK
jgi:hypothetical protein